MSKIYKWILIVTSTSLFFYVSYKAIGKVHFPLGAAQLQLEVQCSVDNKFKAYYSRSSEFSAKKMIEVKLKGNDEFQRIEFLFPPTFNADKFRLHMGTEETTIKLKSIKLSAEKSFQWNAQQIFNEFKPTQMVKSYVLKDGLVEIVTNGESAFLENKNDISSIVENALQNNINRFKPLVYSLILAVFFYAIMHHLLFPGSALRSNA